MANANVKVSYSLICKDLNEAIDAKINTSPTHLTMKLLR